MSKKTIFIEGIYPVAVDYEMNIEALVNSALFGKIESQINSTNFPVQRKGTADIRIMLFVSNGYTLAAKVLHRLSKNDFRSAELRELLALHKYYPELCRTFPVIALGSIWRDQTLPSRYPFRDVVPCILYSEEYSCCCLAVHPIGKFMISPGYRFAVVVK